MGRKDLTKERQTHILNAFEDCIIEYGLFGATLTRVTEKAQVNRGIIHHYFGDRNDLLSALIERLVERYRKEFSIYLQNHKTLQTPELIATYFFDEWGREGSNDNVLIESLVAEAARDPYIHKLIVEVYLELENAIANELKNLYSDATMERCQTVAYAIMSLAYGSSTMLWLGIDRKHLPMVRSLVISMIKTLEKDV